MSTGLKLSLEAAKLSSSWKSSKPLYFSYNTFHEELKVVALDWTMSYLIEGILGPSIEQFDF